MTTRLLFAPLILLMTRVASAECECMRNSQTDKLSEIQSLTDEVEATQRYKALIKAHDCVVDYSKGLAELKETAGHYSEAAPVWCAFSRVGLEDRDWCGKTEAQESALQFRKFAQNRCDELKSSAFVTLGQDAFQALHADGQKIAVSFGGKELSTTEEVLVPVPSGGHPFELSGTCADPQSFSVDLGRGKVALSANQIPLPDCPKPPPATSVVGLVVAGELAVHERLGGAFSGGVSVRPAPMLDVSGFGIFGGRGAGFGAALGLPIAVSDGFNLGPQARLLFLWPYDPPSPRPADDPSMSWSMGLDLKGSFEFGRHSLFLLGGAQYFPSAPQEYSRWVVLLGGGARIGLF